MTVNAHAGTGLFTHWEHARKFFPLSCWNAVFETIGLENSSSIKPVEETPGGKPMYTNRFLVATRFPSALGPHWGLFSTVGELRSKRSRCYQYICLRRNESICFSWAGQTPPSCIISIPVLIRCPELQASSCFIDRLRAPIYRRSSDNGSMVSQRPSARVSFRATNKNNQG